MNNKSEFECIFPSCILLGIPIHQRIQDDLNNLLLGPYFAFRDVALCPESKPISSLTFAHALTPG